MFKRTLGFGTAILIFLSQCCFAQNDSYFDGSNTRFSSEKDSHFDGFNSGIGSACSWFTIKERLNASVPSATIFKTKTFINPSGVSGNAFVGYGKTLRGKYYLGSEMFVNLINASQEIHNVLSGPDGDLVFSTNVRIGKNWGINFLPGYKLNPKTLFYTRWGCVWTFFQERQNASFNGRSFFDTGVNKYVLGASFGFGLMKIISKNISLRLDYNYAYYGSIFNDHWLPFSAWTVESHLSPSSNQLALTVNL
jgi:opacity protein-like surface antigen